jgi:hypothetical protein
MMIITPNSMRSGLLLRGPGMGALGPYWETPPPKDCCPNRGEG